jgi:uncharacterized protein (DUF433 family)
VNLLDIAMSSSDRRELAAYSPAEAAHYLRIPESTVRYWAVGRPGKSKPVVVAAQVRPLVLSFRNLVELHVLGAIRREFNISLPKVRDSIEFLKTRLNTPNPLITVQFETDGVDLFVEHYGHLLNVSQAGQAVMRRLIDSSLSRIERDTRGIPIKLFPYTRNQIENAPRIVVIDPRLSFGRPVIAGTGLATEVIAGRYKAGESIEELAKDYGRPPEEIQEAVRCELQAA